MVAVTDVHNPAGAVRWRGFFVPRRAKLSGFRWLVTVPAATETTAMPVSICCHLSVLDAFSGQFDRP
jgi:hypothetical protein